VKLANGLPPTYNALASPRRSLRALPLRLLCPLVANNDVDDNDNNNNENDDNAQLLYKTT
jgi:hypothetical protein